MRRRKYKNFKSGAWPLYRNGWKGGDSWIVCVNATQPYAGHYAAHCTYGPMYRSSHRCDEPLWLYRGTKYTFDEWCELTKKTEDQIIELKLKYDTHL